METRLSYKEDKESGFWVLTVPRELSPDSAMRVIDLIELYLEKDEKSGLSETLTIETTSGVPWPTLKYAAGMQVFS